jgi:replicative DNA helicase
VFLTDNVPHRIEEIIRIANQHKQQHGIVACIVDYIQLLDYGALSEREAISDAVKKVQISAKHDKIAYILLSQVKQDVATREDHRPQLSDTFGSASLQTGCKLAIGLFRPHKYERIPTGYYQEICNNHPMGTSVYPGIVELWVTKNRSGRSGEFALAWCDLPTGKFHAMDKLANE